MRSVRSIVVTNPIIGFRLTRWLYALCWTGTERPSVLFDRATTWMLAQRVLLPGASVLERFVARLRERVEMRLRSAVRRTGQSRLHSEPRSVAPWTSAQEFIREGRAGMLTASCLPSLGRIPLCTGPL